jgi:hypothetical protein
MPSSAARKLLIPCGLFAGPLNQRRQTARLWDRPDAANQSPTGMRTHHQHHLSGIGGEYSHLVTSASTILTMKLQANLRSTT